MNWQKIDNILFTIGMVWFNTQALAIVLGDYKIDPIKMKLYAGFFTVLMFDSILCYLYKKFNLDYGKKKQPFSSLSEIQPID